MIIYKIINLINGKIYVGQDSKNDENYFGSGIAINNAIQKYEIENFKKEILEYCNSKEQLNEREIYWIKKLNSKTPVGYNMTNGGGGILNPSEETIQKMSNARKGKSSGMKGKTVSEKTRREISEALAGRVLSKERKQKISESNKGISRNKGVLKSEEHKRKMSESVSKAIIIWWKKRKLQMI